MGEVIADLLIYLCREFTAGVIQEVCNMWPGTVMIHGRPRHPQTQGCVERGNGDLQLKLGKWMDEHGTDWSRGLKFVVHAINTSVSSTTGTTPFELAFGQKPRADQALWEQLAAQGVVHEDDLPEDIREQLQEPSLSPSAGGEAEGGSEGSQVDVVVQSGEDGDASGSHNLEHESYSDAVLQCESQGGTGLESHGESGNQSQSSEVSQLESLAGELSMSGSQSDGFSQPRSQSDGFSQPGSQNDGFSQPGSQSGRQGGAECEEC
ncbi:KRAB-A domain-containing protein 2-like [Littorina saxatilis]|uniref:KRAB-A domain-containing protein 2-like n=1 Tax=Littorina saxatilis TaxID=31220 RepID=UPI0038B60C53